MEKNGWSFLEEVSILGEGAKDINILYAGTPQLSTFCLATSQSYKT